ncbi:MAG TPA: porin family protein [Chitinophagales bacterium]|nr:porin family protein [Chitinophagales bacterium]
MRLIRDNDETHDSLERHFRELRNLETPPSSDLWDKVEYKLDEERERVKHDHWYQAIILLLIPVTIINILFTWLPEGNRNKPIDVVNGDALLKRIPLSGSNFPNDPEFSGAWGFFLKGDFFPRKTSSADNVALAESCVEGIPGASIESEEPPLAIQSQHPSGIQFPGTETKVKFDDVINPLAGKAAERTSPVKGFHVGLEGGVNNSWLLHKDNTLHPLIGNMIHRKFDFGVSCGISAGYDFSNRWGIEAEWIIKSLQGQTYWENRYNKILINGQVNLEYMHLPVMVKYKWTKAGIRSPNPKVLNLVAGVQYSRLRGAEVVQNGLDIAGVKELFNRDEMGLLLGVEYDMFFHQNYYISLGARASIATDARAFPYFNSEKTETYNVLIGATASFNYLLRKKRSD